VYFKIYKKEFFNLYLKNGLEIKLRTKSTDLQAFTNVWVLKEYVIKEFETSKNDVVIDIGGHVGLFALYASMMSPNGRIISIEPYSQNFSLLKENVIKNNLNNIIPVNKAITNSNKNIELFIDDNDDSAHSIYNNGKNSIQIESTTLEAIMNENQILECDMLKIDCEGAEFDIIESLSNKELSKIRKIALEYHLKENNKSSLKNLTKRLEEMSFDINIETTNDFLGMLYAKMK
jgi:FkbM family methyltransferase